MRLYMRYAIPFWLEEKIIKKFGFEVESKKFNDMIVFIKHKQSKGDKVTIRASALNNNTIISPGLTESQKKILTDRCDAIVDAFEDPYKTVHAVRTRLSIMARTVKPFAAQQFIYDFIDREFPVDWDATKKGMAGS
jgi:hypothetical protein